ncbi:flagellar hook-basal body complex subunit FliE [Caballeronia pedi]|uniref:Flagellar hook-basal body complex protein FliE n=1 Tax=Caballeronia pedi TaxID=1777141 RepID=A0A158C0S7_9BURK|nr:flagellar hook-basal body complex protein FliE [Caballeronia pedi]SAK75850.1 flagellar hook-basal body complex subunit FliE [Caballeronia pedi]
MNIESIGAYDFANPVWASTTQGTSTSASFSTLLVDGAEHVDEAVRTSNAAVAAFALNADVPPHQVMLALEDARLQLQFALQVRSKLVEGYQELMRMQI